MWTIWKTRWSFFQNIQSRMKTIWKNINTFRVCLKEILSLLISTDIQNLTKEIEYLKKQNQELMMKKKNLVFSLSLKFNESLTDKIDEITKIANDSQSISNKLWILFDALSKEEITLAVDMLLREMKEMKKTEKISSVCGSQRVCSNVFWNRSKRWNRISWTSSKDTISTMTLNWSSLTR